MISKLSHRLRDDDGLGLVLVLGMGAILTGLMIVSTTAALRSVSSSRSHVNFESALAVADGGVDTVLARARRAYVLSGADTYVTPSPADATCAQAAVAWPWPTTQPTTADERAWAKATLEALADAGCLQADSTGDYVILKPTGRQSIYAMSWSPRRGAKEVKSRILKADYLFTPYSPSHAILTGGNLLLDSSTKVTSAPPNDPLLAAVHTNGSISIDSGNPEVFGPVTQSASSPSADSNKFYANAGGDVTGAAKQPIPFEGARSVWARNRLSNPPGGWYDLCPDGTVQTPTSTSTRPCTGSVLADVSAGGSFRGWSFSSAGTVPVWSGGTDIKTNDFSGTYYVSGGDVQNPASNSGAPVSNLTVIASAVGADAATPPTTICNKIGGNITWGSTDPAAPSVPNTFLVADQDLLTTSNYQAGSASGSTIRSGFFIAGDQMEMSTSSNGAFGAVVALDQCNPGSGSLVTINRIKNPSLYYDPNAQAPFTDVINNTLWLEFPS